MSRELTLKEVADEVSTIRSDLRKLRDNVAELERFFTSAKKTWDEIVSSGALGEFERSEMNCPKCGGTNLSPKWIDDIESLRWSCFSCRYKWYDK